MPKILNFKKSEHPFEIRNKTETSADIVLYGVVGGGMFEDGIDAKKVLEEIKKLPKDIKNLNIRINSPGGDVFQGITIYNILKQHSAKKTVYIDGLAASIASIISLAGDEIVMGDGALYMIHLPWTWTAGNRNDLDKTVNLLMDIEEQMISIYTKKSGLGRAEVRAMLEKETWLNADETIEMGFATIKSEDETSIAASVFDKATWITKKPTIANTKEAKVKNEIEILKSKVNGFLARK